MKDDFNDEIVYMAPAVGVSTLSFFGVSLPDGVYLLTAFYIIVQIICTIYRVYKDTRGGK